MVYGRYMQTFWKFPTLTNLDIQQVLLDQRMNCTATSFRTEWLFIGKSDRSDSFQELCTCFLDMLTVKIFTNYTPVHVIHNRPVSWPVELFVETSKESRSSFVWSLRGEAPWWDFNMLCDFTAFHLFLSEHAMSFTMRNGKKIPFSLFYKTW